MLRDNRNYKLIGRLLVCFDVSPELPNNSPKVTFVSLFLNLLLRKRSLKYFFPQWLIQPLRCARNGKPEIEASFQLP